MADMADGKWGNWKGVCRHYSVQKSLGPSDTIIFKPKGSIYSQSTVVCLTKGIVNNSSGFPLFCLKFRQSKRDIGYRGLKLNPKKVS